MFIWKKRLKSLKQVNASNISINFNQKIDSWVPIKIYSLVVTLSHQTYLVMNHISRLIKFVSKDLFCSNNFVTLGSKV